MTENAFIGGANIFDRPSHSGPVHLLPHGIQNIVVTYAKYRSSEHLIRRFRILVWLEEMDMASFPELRRIEVVYFRRIIPDDERYRSRSGYNDGNLQEIKDAYEAPEPMQTLRAAGVEVVIRTH
jgi:hypothetical protein